jgi:hypothetical protein
VEAVVAVVEVVEADVLRSGVVEIGMYVIRQNSNRERVLI